MLANTSTDDSGSVVQHETKTTSVAIKSHCSVVISVNNIKHEMTIGAVVYPNAVDNHDKGVQNSGWDIMHVSC